MVPNTKNLPARYRKVGLTNKILTKFKKYCMGIISSTVFKSEKVLEYSGSFKYTSMYLLEGLHYYEVTLEFW